MSQNSKKHRAQRDARQEKQAKSVINWIFIGLIILAIVFLLVYMINFM
jgi:flagellar basal body-associated protein FliL